MSDKSKDSCDPLANELDMWQRAGAASFLEFERNLADNLTDPLRPHAPSGNVKWVAGSDHSRPPLVVASSGGSSERPPSDGQPLEFAVGRFVHRVVSGEHTLRVTEMVLVLRIRELEAENARLREQNRELQRAAESVAASTPTGATP